MKSPRPEQIILHQEKTMISSVRGEWGQVSKTLHQGLKIEKSIYRLFLFINTKMIKSIYNNEQYFLGKARLINEKLFC